MPRLAAFGVTSLRTKISSHAVSPETEHFPKVPTVSQDPKAVSSALKSAWRTLKPTQENTATEMSAEEPAEAPAKSHDGADMARQLREAFQSISAKTETT